MWPRLIHWLINPDFLMVVQSCCSSLMSESLVSSLLCSETSQRTSRKEGRACRLETGMSPKAAFSVQRWPIFFVPIISSLLLSSFWLKNFITPQKTFSQLLLWLWADVKIQELDFSISRLHKWSMGCYKEFAHQSPSWNHFAKKKLTQKSKPEG